MKKEKKFNEDTLDAVKSLMKDRWAYTNRDQMDLDTARSVLSGFGFDEKDQEYRGNKPEITVPVLNPWINQVVSAYTSAPFGIGLKSTRPDMAPYRMVFDKIQANINEIASKALIEELGVGYTYALITTEFTNYDMNWQTPVIKLVDARKVVVGYSEDDELDDCDIALVIDVISKDKAKDKYELDEYDLRGNRDILKGYDIVMDSKTQCSVVTVYERNANGVQITKIVYNKIVEQTTLPLTRIPLVRFYGDTCYIEKEAHYRGVYQLVSDLWKLVNYGASEIQARVATAPTANYIGDPAAIAEDPEAYETGSERNFLPSRSWNGGEQLPQVTQVDKSLHINELQTAVTGFMGTITQLLGSASPEGRQNETAEAVLARKSMAEATVNKYLNNLKKSLKSVGKIVLEMMSIYYDVPRIEDGSNIPALTDISGIEITVDDGPIQASQRQKNLQQVIAFYQMAKESNPQAFTVVGPAILQLSDIPMDIKQAITPLFSGNPAQNIQMIQQQMQQTQMQNQQLQTQLVEANKNISMLQQSLFEMQNDSKASMWQTQQKIASEERKHAMDLQWEREKFMMELQAKAGKLTFDAIEQEKDRQLEAQIEADKMMVELEKDRNAAREQAMQIEVPVFTPSKFT